MIGRRKSALTTQNTVASGNLTAAQETVGVEEVRGDSGKMAAHSIFVNTKKRPSSEGVQPTVLVLNCYIKLSRQQSLHVARYQHFRVRQAQGRPLEPA